MRAKEVSKMGPRRPKAGPRLSIWLQGFSQTAQVTSHDFCVSKEESDEPSVTIFCVPWLREPAEQANTCLCVPAMARGLPKTIKKSLKYISSAFRLFVQVI